MPDAVFHRVYLQQLLKKLSCLRAAQVQVTCLHKKYSDL